MSVFRCRFSDVSSCDDFGRGADAGGGDALIWVSADDWNAFEPLAPDRGGGFLICWFRHMPGFGSVQAFPDGRRMPSVWPSGSTDLTV